MIMYIIAIIFLLFFLAAPLRTKIVLSIINLFLPDPIPFIDEFIMVVNTLNNLIRVGKVIEFIRSHKALSVFLFKKF